MLPCVLPCAATDFIDFEDLARSNAIVFVVFNCVHLGKGALAENATAQHSVSEVKNVTLRQRAWTGIDLVRGARLAVDYPPCAMFQI